MKPLSVPAPFGELCHVEYVATLVHRIYVRKTYEPAGQFRTVEF